MYLHLPQFIFTCLQSKYHFLKLTIPYTFFNTYQKINNLIVKYLRLYIDINYIDFRIIALTHVY